MIKFGTMFCMATVLLAGYNMTYADSLEAHNKEAFKEGYDEVSAVNNETDTSNDEGEDGCEGEEERMTADDVLKKHDTDSDGSISLKEFKEAFKDEEDYDEASAGDFFNEIDTNGDGNLSRDEIEAQV